MNNQNEYSHLIEEILSGSDQAYGELYDKTILNVYRNVHFLIEDQASVDDVVQDVYIQVFKSLSKYDSSRPFQPWLMGVIIKQVQTYRRKRWMGLRIINKAEEYRQEIVTDFSNDLVDKISNQQLIDLVNRLPYKLKQVVILRYLNDYSQEEVAKILEIPLGTVKSRIHSALKKLNFKVQHNNFFLEKVRMSNAESQ